MKRVLLIVVPLFLLPLALSAQQVDQQAASNRPAPEPARQEAVQAPTAQASEQTAETKKKENCEAKKKAAEEAKATTRTET